MSVKNIYGGQVEIVIDPNGKLSLVPSRISSGITTNTGSGITTNTGSNSGFTAKRRIPLSESDEPAKTVHSRTQNCITTIGPENIDESFWVRGKLVQDGSKIEGLGIIRIINGKLFIHESSTSSIQSFNYKGFSNTISNGTRIYYSLFTLPFPKERSIPDEMVKLSNSDNTEVHILLLEHANEIFMICISSAIAKGFFRIAKGKWKKKYLVKSRLDLTTSRLDLTTSRLDLTTSSLDLTDPNPAKSDVIINSEQKAKSVKTVTKNGILAYKATDIANKVEEDDYTGSVIKKNIALFSPLQGGDRFEVFTNLEGRVFFIEYLCDRIIIHFKQNSVMARKIIIDKEKFANIIYLHCPINAIHPSLAEDDTRPLINLLLFLRRGVAFIKPEHVVPTKKKMSDSLLDNMEISVVQLNEDNLSSHSEGCIPEEEDNDDLYFN